MVRRFQWVGIWILVLSESLQCRCTYQRKVGVWIYMVCTSTALSSVHDESVLRLVSLDRVLLVPRLSNCGRYGRTPRTRCTAQQALNRFPRLSLYRIPWKCNIQMIYAYGKSNEIGIGDGMFRSVLLAVFEVRPGTWLVKWTKRRSRRASLKSQMKPESG